MWLRRWTAGQLIRSWIVYWAVLLGVVTWRPLWRYIQIQGSNGHGEVSLSYSGGVLPIVLWIAGPPLILFIVWFFSRSRSREREGVK
jgi:hypothetical protein